MRRALAIWKKISRDVITDRNIASTNFCIGLCFKDLTRLEEANLVFQQALTIYENSSCDVTTDLDIASLCKWIAQCLISMYQLKEA